jgi:hypothetical protein
LRSWANWADARVEERKKEKASGLAVCGLRLGRREKRKREGEGEGKGFSFLF